MRQNETTFGWLFLPIHIFLIPQLVRWLLPMLHLSVSGSGYNALCFALSLVVVLIAFSRYFSASGKTFAQHFGRSLGAIVLGFALQYTLTALLLAFLTKLFGNIPNPNNDIVVEYASQDALPVLFCALIAAPIVEETLLRGAIFSSLYPKNKFFAYFLSSALFAAMHVWQFSDLGVATLLVAGVCYLPSALALAWTQQQSDGAKRIIVEIQNGGMTLLRVTDDGCGMSREDAQTAFLRHATSKIHTAEDLESIGTLGFRGEALAATAAVSRIRLLTKQAEDALGTALEIEGGKILSVEDAGCPNGTTMIVRDLFFNTPARMKFMKRDTAESSAVLAAVQHQALAHPEIAFSLLRDGQEVLSTAGDGDLLAAIYQVCGREFAASLCKVDGRYDDVKLHGFVTKPSATRGSRSSQSFYVNGRFVKSRLLTAALEEAYRNSMMVGRFPGCVLCITLPERMVDVNVHPAKTEVKFLNERAVFDCVHYGVQAALRAATDRPEARFARPKTDSPAPKPKQEAFRTMSAQEYKKLADELHRDTHVRPSPSVAQVILQSAANRETTMLEESTVISRLRAQQPQTPTPKPISSQPETEQITLPEPTKADAPYTLIGEVLDTYLIVEQAQTVYFIDKHAAHERILFEKLKAQKADIAAQMLLTPETAPLSPEEAAAVLDNRELLSRCGFDVDDFGGTVLIRQIPADLSPDQAVSTLTSLASDLLDGKTLDPSALHDELLHTVACKAAIKGGWHTSAAEREALVREVMTRDDLKHCPHGRPICIQLTEQNLEKQFKRT